MRSGQDPVLQILALASVNQVSTQALALWQPKVCHLANLCILLLLSPICAQTEMPCLLGCMHSGLDACAAGKQAEEGAAGSHSSLGRQQHVVAQQGECCLDFASGHGAQRHCQDAIRRSAESVCRNRVFHRRTRIPWATVQSGLNSMGALCRSAGKSRRCCQNARGRLSPYGQDIFVFAND